MPSICPHVSFLQVLTNFHYILCRISALKVSQRISFWLYWSTVTRNLKPFIKFHQVVNCTEKYDIYGNFNTRASFEAFTAVMFLLGCDAM
jgi:hypothetical protein